MTQFRKRGSLALAFVALVAAAALAPISGAMAQKVHYVAFHVDSGNVKTHNLTLNNITNLTKYYEDRGEKVIIEVVANGPGLHMLRTDTSKVKDRIEKISLELDNVSFAACGNTKIKMTKKEGRDIPIMAEAKPIPAGVARLIALQKKGWAYIKP